MWFGLFLSAISQSMMVADLIEKFSKACELATEFLLRPLLYGNIAGRGPPDIFLVLTNIFVLCLKFVFIAKVHQRGW